MNQGIFDATSVPAQKADILRYEILLRHGGVYADFDVEPLKPLDDLVKDLAFFAGRQAGPMIAIGLLGCTPGHPILAEVVRRIRRTFVARTDITRQTGPDVFTEAVERVRKRSGGLPHDDRIFAPAFFYPYLPGEGSADGDSERKWPRAFAVHHWHKSWEGHPSDDIPVPLRIRAAAVGPRDLLASLPIALADTMAMGRSQIRRRSSDATKRMLRRVADGAELTPPPPSVPVARGNILVQTRHGFPILTPADDLDITPCLVGRGTYEGNVIDYLSGTVPAASTVVDVGANIGLHTIALGRTVGPAGRVISYECNPAALERLVANVRMNELAERVEIRPFAAGAHPGSATLHYSQTQLGRGRLSDSPDERPASELQTRQVQVEPIEVPDGEFVEFVKIDVEGSECAVLAGLDPLVGSGRVGRVMIEVKPELLRGGWEELETRLLGYAASDANFAVIDDAGRPRALPIDEVLATADFANLVIEFPSRRGDQGGGRQ